MLTKQDIEDQRELAQNDLQCLLDGSDDTLVTNACQIIVDRMNILIARLEDKQTWEYLGCSGKYFYWVGRTNGRCIYNCSKTKEAPPTVNSGYASLEALKSMKNDLGCLEK